MHERAFDKIRRISKVNNGPPEGPKKSLHFKDTFSIYNGGRSSHQTLKIFHLKGKKESPEPTLVPITTVVPSLELEEETISQIPRRIGKVLLVQFTYGS